MAFLQDLAVVMITAGIVTVMFQWLKQPVVLGYIVAGILIGPHFSGLFLEGEGFPLVHDQETIRTLAELGMVFLMFSLGLEFNLRKLRLVGATAFIAAPLAILLMIFLGYQAGRLFLWNPANSLFLGAIISICSTSVLFKVLREMGREREPFADLIFGILIVEDILGVALIVLLTGFAETRSMALGEVASALAKLAVFLVSLLVVGLLLVPRLLHFVSRFESSERLLITVLGLCFGTALLSAKIGFSVALGAFLIGAIIAESREIGRVRHLVDPVRDLFSAVFFVSIGLLVEPKMLWEQSLPIAVISLLVMGGQIAGNTFGTIVAGHDFRNALRVGTGLSQIGEFSFVIATLGLTLGVTNDSLFPIVVAVALVTTFLTPMWIRNADRLADQFERLAPRPVTRWLSLYKQWVERFKDTHWNHMATKLARKWLWQMAINLALIAGLLLGAAWLAKFRSSWLAESRLKWFGFLPEGEAWPHGILWLAAMLLSLPMLIANLRKTHALGMLVSEVTIRHGKAGERTQGLRAAVANVVLIAGTVVMALCVLLASSALLPPWNILLALATGIAVVAWLQWRWLVRVYSKAQIALVGTLDAPTSKGKSERGETPELLPEALLRSVQLRVESPACGQTIHELNLHAGTGADVAGIERTGVRMINPAPEEELRPGDIVLLLGDGLQLEKAVIALTDTKTAHHPSGT